MDLRNKTVAFLGDSITEGYGVKDQSNRYDQLLLRNCGLKAAHNYGIGGSRLAHQRNCSENPREDLCFCGRAYNMAPDADLIIVFGGTNDYGHGDVPFGAMTDTTPATYCGAVEFLMCTIPELYPTSKLVFLAPARRLGDEARSTDPRKPQDGRPLRDYVDVILKKGQEHGIPVLDLYTQYRIDPNVEAERTAYAEDGLHFNDAGHQILCDLLKNFLEKL